MRRIDALEAIVPFKGDDGISLTTMRSIGDWYRVGGAPGHHFDNIGCMGGAAPTALGIALAQPQRRVIVFDGDGSLIMQLGVLASVSEAQPENFYHFVMVNGVYETSGLQPTPVAGVVDFAKMALGAGYKAAYTLDDVAVLRERLPAIMAEPGPVLIALKTDPQNDAPPGSTRTTLPDPSAWPDDAAMHLRKQLVSG